jgi:hypothetical protein
MSSTSPKYALSIQPNHHQTDRLMRLSHFHPVAKNTRRSALLSRDLRERSARVVVIMWVGVSVLG